MKACLENPVSIRQSTLHSDRICQAGGIECGRKSCGLLISESSRQGVTCQHVAFAENIDVGDPVGAFGHRLWEEGVSADVSKRQHASSMATDAEARESDGEWLTTPAISKTNFQDFGKRDCIDGCTRQCAFSGVKTLLSHRGPYYSVIGNDFHNRNPPVSDAFSFRKEGEARYVSEWKHEASLAMPLAGSVG